MKQPKKPTLIQKKLIKDCGLDPKEWMVRLEDNDYLHIASSKTGQFKILDKKLRKSIVSHAEKERIPT